MTSHANDMAKAPIGIPIVASLAALVLVLQALLSGSRPGFLEQCDIVTLNTSKLGRNLAKTMGPAQTLVIQDFYSLHVLDFCQGNFRPNATAKGARRNVTGCDAVLVTGYNVSAILDHQLSMGPFNLSLRDIQFPQELQDDLDRLHGTTEAFAIILISGAGFTGVACLVSFLSLWLLPKHERFALLLNLMVSCCAALTLVLAALIDSVGAHVTADKINRAGADVGLSAAVGVEMEAFTWTGAGLMVVTLSWCRFHQVRVRQGYTINTAAPRSRTLSDVDEKHNQARHVRTGEGA